MDLYKVNNFPVLHPVFGVLFLISWKENIWQSLNMIFYAAVPTEHDIRICMVTEGYPMHA